MSVKRVGQLRFTMQVKLVLSFLLVGLLPMAISSMVVLNLGSNEMIKQEQESMRSLAVSTAQGMEQWLTIRLAELEVASQTEGMISMDPARQLAVVHQLKKQSEAYENVVFTGADGLVRAHTNEASIGVMNLGDRDYFITGMQGQSSISSVLVSKGTGNRIVVVAVPVKGENGRVQGVLSAPVNFEQLIHQFLESENVTAKGMFPVLVDKEDRLQVFPDAEMIGKGITEIEADEDLVSVLGMGKSESGHSIIDVDGKEFVVAYAPVSLANYGLYLHRPMDLVLAVTNEVKLGSFIILGISAILIALLAWLISRSFSRNLQVITDQVKRVAEGDLSGEDIQARSRDEIGELTQHFNRMTRQLRELIQRVGSSAEQVAASAEELTASADQTAKTTELVTSSIQQVSAGAGQQNEGLAESARSLEEISTGVQQIAEVSSSISESSTLTLEKAQEGGQCVQKTVDQMGFIRDSVTETDTLIRSLEERSKEIGEILDVINGIAAQTNLLALNAAIEAARAGEQGRGFAVVADEVRKLAEESQRSSSLIGHLIHEIQKDMIASTTSMAQVKNEVGQGLIIANETRRNFEEIVEATNKVAIQMESMASTAQQMSAGTQEVTTSFTEIARIAQQTTGITQEVAASSEEQLASMEEITSSAASLSNMAEELQQWVRKFKV
ncbi:methyl-accepting chemotaxis protein [Ammoniphilus sp. CFH 90114]|uniref:methyl-accepting chemotaxis protein n=1 Tax=Ammoniphilus sp. CFH 90114 TaxID=2493665 RepID=UPI0013E9702C|nr:methyl-accepting chemotaxis protein [Ammoniphilus sp. CFH 90114]